MFSVMENLFGWLKRAYLLSVHHMKLEYLRLRGAEIGNGTWILVDLLKHAAVVPGRLKIGSRCVICEDTVLVCGEGYRLLLKRDPYKKRDCDGITIMDNCFIGVGTVILNGVSIGPNSIVGAGAVVFDDVKPNTCVAGNPARFVCSLDAYARVSAGSLIEGYGEFRSKGISKSEFLTRHFWEDGNL